MKTRLFFAALCAVTLSSCNLYYVPDDFPKEEFYSYAPYKKGDVIQFVNSNNDKLVFQIAEVQESYLRGKKGCKCGKEQIYKDVTFSKEGVNEDGKEETFVLSLSCIDRNIFNVSLRSYAQSYELNAFYEAGNRDEDIWARSFDNYKIFKSFADEIVLTQEDKPAAKVKKGQGLLWFVDETGRTWTAE
ncbi:MAG: hypothetical protein J5621_08600 [Paludibacteraceae bacterium]|nr:hypothetical protein [Paludibacteraceae bacterium]